MNSPNAIRSAELAASARRIYGARIDSTSSRGLPRSQWSVRCETCGKRRVHNADGLRRCPCGVFYVVCVGAVIS